MYSVEKTRGINFFKRFDYILFISVLLLSIIGIIVLSSATWKMRSGPEIMQMQIMGLLIGIVVAIMISTFDYKDFKTLGIFFYIFCLVLLVVVLVIGSGDELGNRNWIKLPGLPSIQPSQLALIAYVILTSVFLERIKEKAKNMRSNVIKLLVYSAIPIALVLKEGDIGTVLVFIFIFFVMVFICGLPYRYILIMLGTFSASLPFVWFYVLNDKRRARITSFLHPEKYASGEGYNVLHSKLAVGSGQLFGQGFRKGIQTQSGSVPVRESDFIFSVVGEELGFIGAVVIILLLFFILLRCLYIAKNSRDVYGSFVVVGMTSMLAFYAIENIGMGIGILPVTGLPLPFISQGGTAMVTNYIAIGIILSVSIRRQRVIFNSSQ